LNSGIGNATVPGNQLQSGELLLCCAGNGGLGVPATAINFSLLHVIMTAAA